ncbi:MAG: glutathione S-transferase family protein [Pseudomonadales bacterium]|nr:glutathione S-transferase family protein [Pseudomonadales bacterium]
MSLTQPLRLKGAPGSPYTRKMLAYMRYRHISYELLIGDHSIQKMGLPTPKVDLLPTFYLPNDQGEVEAVVDSTPLIRRFEQAFTGRQALPTDPVLGFINYLIEDYADEWLTKSMFHYRWYYDADIKKAGDILPLWRGLQMDDDQHSKAAEFVAARQISRLYVVGSNDLTAPVIEASYVRFLDIMNRLVMRQPYLFGDRPASADFGIYAQLTQLAKFDPTPMSICLKQAPRVFAWTDVVDDLSGQVCEEDGWIARDIIKEVLGDLLTEIGKVYAPALLANARALQSGEKQMKTTIGDRPWQQPAFPYQGRCLQWINEEYQKLNDDEQRQVDDILAGTGCEMLLLPS